MQIPLRIRTLLIFLVFVVMAGGGCSRSPAPRFYTLSPVQDQFSSGRRSSGQNAVVGVGPVKLADYLDQAQLVTSTSDNQVAKAEFDRWVGPLKNNVVNVLADNIGSLLPTQEIHLYPWRQSVAIDFQVAVEVSRFDGRRGDAAHLESRWSLFRGPDKKLVKTRRSSISEPVTGPDYADLVAAQSRALGRLSQEIVQGIRGAGRAEPGRGAED